MVVSYSYGKGNIAILRNSMCQRVKKQCDKGLQGGSLFFISY